MVKMEDPFERLRREMDFMFNKFFKEQNIRFPEFKQPLSDIEDNGKEIVINVDLPGVDKKDIDLIVTENFIEIKTRRKSKIEIKKKHFYKQERSYSGYNRVIPLPGNIDIDKAQSEYKEGVLTIRIPKKGIKLEKKKDKKLAVK